MGQQEEALKKPLILLLMYRMIWRGGEIRWIKKDQIRFFCDVPCSFLGTPIVVLDLRSIIPLCNIKCLALPLKDHAHIRDHDTASHLPAIALAQGMLWRKLVGTELARFARAQFDRGLEAGEFTVAVGADRDLEHPQSVRQSPGYFNSAS